MTDTNTILLNKAEYALQKHLRLRGNVIDGLSMIQAAAGARDAILTALLEPSEDMCRAGYFACGCELSFGQVRDVFRAMVEEIQFVQTVKLEMGKLQEFAHAMIFNEPNFHYSYKSKTMPKLEWEAQGYEDVSGQPAHPTLVLVRKPIHTVS